MYKQPRASRASVNQQFVLCAQLEVGWVPPATLQVLCSLLLCSLQNSGSTWKPHGNSRSYPGEQKSQVASPR